MAVNPVQQLGISSESRARDSRGVDVVLASRRAQNFDCQFFRAFGIEPVERPIIAVKSAQHFRADYAPIASGIAIVDEGDGITSHNVRSLSYRRICRQIWPLDEIEE